MSYLCTKSFPRQKQDGDCKKLSHPSDGEAAPWMGFRVSAANGCGSLAYSIVRLGFQMKNASKRLWVFLALLTCAGILRATLPQTTVGTWTSASSLGQARANAAAVMLSDGRILITGGDAGSGALQSAEIFGTNGSASAAGAMNVARSGHFAVVLSDGRVLVGGGNSSGGGATNSAEIYDPSSDTWTQTSPMTQGRADATAALLQDGRVLIAGGDNSGTPSNTVEVFDPTSGDFSFAGTLSSPRCKHAMAILPDGRVLIVGGSDGANALASSDIFDPASGGISGGPSLATARYAHSATTLLDGRVAVIGGTDGAHDLASAEIYDPANGGFSNAGAALVTAREGHQAFLLPNNNDVLIVGGTTSGTAVPASELFTPQISSSGVWSSSFSATGANVTARSAAVGSAMKQDGLLLAAGGDDASGNALASTELYAFPTIKTDQADYAPGSIVTITGSGWQPGEAVTLTLVESPLIDTHPTMTAVADANGNISNNQFSPDAYDVNVKFYLTAVGGQSGLQAGNTFTDAQVQTVTVGSPTSVAVTAGNTAVYGTLIVKLNGNANNCTVNLSATGLPSGASPVFGTNPGTSNSQFTSTFSVTTTAATAAGTYTFNVTGTEGANCQHPGTATASNNLTLVVNAGTVANTITTSPTGLQVSIDGGAPQTAPVTVNWIPGSNHTIATTSPQSNGTTSQFVWTDWSDSGAISHGVSAQSTSTTYTATFKTQFQLTFAASGLGADTTGTIVTVNGSAQSTVPYQAFFDSGSTVTYTYLNPVASTVSGKQYALTTPAPTPASPITVSAATTIAASYKTQWQLTFTQTGVGADGTGTIVSVNGAGQSTLPYQAFFDAGSTVTYAYADPVASTAPGKRYALTTPSPTPASPITVSAAVTVTGRYKVQWQLTFTQSGIGADGTGTIVTVNGTGQSTLPYQAFFDEGSNVTYAYSDPVTSTVPGKRYALSVPAPAPASPITVSAAVTVTGTYKTQWQVTFAQSGVGADGTGTIVTVNASPQSVLPYQAYFDEGSSVTYAYSDPVASSVPGKRYALTAPTPTPPTPITVSAAVTVTGTYKTQWQLTFAQTGIGVDGTGTIVTVNAVPQSILPYQAFFDEGSNVTYSYASAVAVSATKQYRWDSISGIGQTAQSNTFSVTTTGTVTGSYVAQFKITFDASANAKADSSATIVTVDGSPLNGASLPFTTPFLDTGHSLTYSYATPVASTASPTNTQYRWDTTSGLGQTMRANTFLVADAGTVTGSYVAQYKVSFDASGNVKADSSATIVKVGATPLNAASLPFTTDFVDNGTQLTYSYYSPVASSASPTNTQYRWDTTTGLQSAQGITFAVTSAGSILGNYVAQYKITFDTSANVKADSNSAIVTVGGAPQTAASLPFTTNFLDSGSQLSYSYYTPVTSLASPANTRYRWNTTSGLGQSLQTNAFTVSAPGTVTGSYTQQFLVTFNQTGIGADVSPAAIVVTVNGAGSVFAMPLFSNWFDTGSMITYAYSSPVATTATGKRYILTGAAPAPASPFNVTMPFVVSATYKPQYDTTTGVSSSANPSVLAQPIHFTATITAQAGGPTPNNGSVQFVIDGSNFGTPVPVVSGTANSGNTSSLSVGSHNVQAVFTPVTNDFTGSNGSLSQVVQYSTGACLGSAGHAILQPINTDGTSVFKQKSTVPAKFRVCDFNGNSIGTAGVVTSFNLVRIVSGTVDNTVNETVESTTPDTMFRWDPTAMQWIFNINTKSLSASTTYYYNVGLNDGSNITFMFGLK